MDLGATTAGRLAEITGLTSGAVTRVIDRLEQAGYVRRVPDPADRRRVIVEVVPEKVAAIQSTLGRIGEAGARGDRPLHRRAARADRRLPDPHGADHARRSDDAPREPRGGIGGRVFVRAFRAARWPDERSTAHPIGPVRGSPAPRSDAGRALSRGVRGRDAAGPSPRRARHRPVPRPPVRLAEAKGDARSQLDDPMDDRDRRRRPARRGRPPRDRTGPVRADRRDRADPARARAAAWRGRDQARRRRSNRPPRAPAGQCRFA